MGSPPRIDVQAPVLLSQPVTLSSKNCLAAAGVTPRRFLSLVRDLRVPHFRDGRLVLVLASDWAEAMRAHATRLAHQRDGAETILLAIGERRKGTQ